MEILHWRAFSPIELDSSYLWQWGNRGWHRLWTSTTLERQSSFCTIQIVYPLETSGGEEIILPAPATWSCRTSISSNSDKQLFLFSCHFQPLYHVTWRGSSDQVKSSLTSNRDKDNTCMYWRDIVGWIQPSRAGWWESLNRFLVVPQKWFSDKIDHHSTSEWQFNVLVMQL